jgi:hypothetical protein
MNAVCVNPSGECVQGKLFFDHANQLVSGQAKAIGQGTAAASEGGAPLMPSKILYAGQVQTDY